MPVPTVPKQRLGEGLRGFLGINLRRDRLSLADGAVARAINADFHRTPGVALLRLGRTNQSGNNLGATLRRLAKHNSVRYQVAGTTLYADETSILTGLSLNLFTTLQPFRPLNDTSEWIYIADDSLMRKYDGTNVRNWGIAAPSAAPTIVAGSGTGLTGDYSAVYIYVRVVGSSIATRSSPSATPTAVTLANEDLDVTVVASSDAQVTNIRIFRTVAGGTAHLFDQQVANASATITSTQADSALGDAVETDNSVPNNASWVALHQGHLFLCRDASNPHYLWWSKRFREEVPADQFLEIGNPSDPIQGALPLAGFLGVFTRLTKYRVLGNTTAGFVFQEALSSRGTPAPQAAIVTARGAIFPARDGIFLTNFLEPDTELSQAIEPLFYEQHVNGYAPIDWNRASEMAMAEYKNRVYFSYPTVYGENLVAVYSLETGQWYMFDYNADFRALYVEEDVDDFVAGGSSGIVQVLEDAAQSDDNGTAIALSLEPATRAGVDQGLLKLFQYMKFDIDAGADTVTVQVWVDEVLRHTFTVTGNRLRTLRRLPARLLGHTWRVTITSSAVTPVAVYGLQMAYVPLEAV